MSALTVIGSGWGALLVVPLFASPRTRRFAATLASVIVVTSITVFVVKHLVQRRRPYLVLADVHPVVFAAPTDFSFPSGHAAGSFAFATFVAVVLTAQAMRAPRLRTRRIALSAVALVVAFGIAVSRCALGVHFPGDVMAGALVGATCGALGARWYLRREAADAVSGT